MKRCFLKIFYCMKVTTAIEPHPDQVMSKTEKFKPVAFLFDPWY